MEEKENINANQKTKKSFKETVVLMIRKRWLSNTAQTVLLVAVLFAVFIAINLYVQSLDLTELDVTENKIYTLSDTSKDIISKINKDVTIYFYGIAEDSSLGSFVKQYTKANNHIKSQILNEETNLEKVQEYELTSDYSVIIIECGETHKIIDSSYELYSYDYTTGQEVDLTEQTITNSILAITTDNKPNVYFTTGHDEYELKSDMGVLSTYLGNEAYITSNVNLLTTGKVPDNCDLLVIVAPISDFMEQEVESILAYINKGGNIIFSLDVGNIAETYPNLQKIYDVYGVTINHSGYVYETDKNRALADYPNIFMPEVSQSNEITSQIYSDGTGTLWLVFAGRLEFKSDEDLDALKVKKDELLKSSENAKFIADLSKPADELQNSAEVGPSVISALLTKTIQEEDKGNNVEAIESNAIFIANSSFITDYPVSQISSDYPLSYLGKNKDFMLNSVSYLTKKDDVLKIRKDMSNSTYTPTQAEHRTVLTIVFAMPVVIIVAGIIIWNYRRRKR